MKDINPKSLWYRMFTVYALNSPKNKHMDTFSTCYYFWQNVSAFFAILFIIGIGTFLLITLLDPIFTFIGYMVTGQWHWFFSEGTFMIGLVLYAFGLIGLVSIFYEDIKCKFPKVFPKEINENKFTGLFSEYYRAVKSKVCPTLRVKRQGDNIQ